MHGAVMDIQLARTFLEIIAAGNFVNAAKRLHLTQSAVSLRVRRLEEELGRPVFLRTKSGTELTPAGQQFQRYATSLVRIWEEARQQVAIPAGFRTMLSVGGQYSLWERLLLRWIPVMQVRAPDVAIRAEVGMPARLMREMVEGIIDIGVMYTPQLRPGLDVETLFEDELVLVSTNPQATNNLDDSYVFMDWGPEFQAAHTVTYPDYLSPGVALSLGSLGLNYILRNKRTGYFPMRVAKSHIEDQRLFLVPDAPVFPFPAYVIYHKDLEADLIELSLDEMRKIAGGVDERVEDREILGIDPRALGIGSESR